MANRKQIDEELLKVLGQIKDVLSQRSASNNTSEKSNDIKNLSNTVYNGINTITNAISKIVGVWSDLQDANYKLGRSIGFNAMGLESFYAASRRHTREIAASIGIETEHLMQLRQGFIDVTNKAQILNAQQEKFMGAMSKFSDIETINKMVGEMDNMGASVDQAMATLAKSQNLANKWGLNAKKNASLIAENIHLATSYSFNRGVDGLSRMVSQAQKLKINVESIANISEKFTTLESAIETSANLQVLGGSYAMQFGNPLQVAYEAMADLESFQDRIVRTFSDKGIFNRETGIVEFSPIDRMMMREAGKQLGLSTKEVMNLASQQAKISEIENELVNAEGISKDDKELITSLARYDESTKKWVVDTLDAEGRVDKTISVENITKGNVDLIKKYRGSQEGLYNDVASIRQTVIEMAGKTRSAKEWFGGAKSVFGNTVAEWGNSTLYGGQQILQNLPPWIGLGMAGVGGWLLRGGLAKGFGSIASSKSFQSILRHPKLIGKILPKLGGYGLLAAGVVAGGTFLLDKIFNTDSKSAYKEDGKNTKYSNEETYNSSNYIDYIGDSTTNELKKQTALLAQIADNGSVGYNGYDLVRFASHVNYRGYNGFNYISTPKTIEDALMRQEEGYAVDGVGDVLSMGGSLMAGALKLANPLGWLTFGSELAQLVSGQDDNKTWSRMNGALGGATIGATIGSVIPVIGTATGAVIGGAIGGVLTRLDEYFGSNENAIKDAIKDLPSAMQGRFETSKFGSIDINDPQIERRANYAIVKIHDLLITWFHAVAKKEDFEIDFTEGLSSEQIKNAEQFGTTSILPQPIYQEYGSGDIYSMPIAGQESYVSRNYQNVSYYNNEPQTVNGNIDLNINGTLKLVGDNSMTSYIDMDKLLDDSSFRTKIVDIVITELNSRSNNGRGLLKDSNSYIGGNSLHTPIFYNT